MSVLSEARALEVKLQFFNEQPPELQEQLVDSGYFSSDDEDNAA